MIPTEIDGRKYYSTAQLSGLLGVETRRATFYAYRLGWTRDEKRPRGYYPAAEVDDYLPKLAARRAARKEKSNGR